MEKIKGEESNEDKNNHERLQMWWGNGQKKGRIEL